MADHHLMVHTDQACPRLSIYLILSNPRCLLPQPGRNSTAVLHFEVDVDSFLIQLYSYLKIVKDTKSQSQEALEALRKSYLLVTTQSRS